MAEVKQSPKMIILSSHSREILTGKISVVRRKFAYLTCNKSSKNSSLCILCPLTL